MPEELRKLKPGERIEGIPGPTWNAFVDAVEYVRKLQQSLTVDPLRNVPQTGIVRLKNASGQTRNRFDVLGVSDVFPKPVQNPNAFKSGPVLHGVTPNKDEHAGKFAILLEPAKPDGIVAACLSGVCVAKVNVEPDQEWMEYADLKDGDAGALEADCHGSARILWKESGYGIKWAVVRLSNVPKQVYGAGTGAGKVAPGAKLPCVTPIHEEHIEVTASGLKVPVAGMYAFGFQATLKRKEPPRNAIMRMQLFVGEYPTEWIGYRENHVHYLCQLRTTCCDGVTPAWGETEEKLSLNSYGSYYGCDVKTIQTAENVAVSGLVKVPKKDMILAVRNTGQVEYTATSFLFWARKLVEPDF